MPAPVTPSCRWSAAPVEVEEDPVAEAVAEPPEDSLVAVPAEPVVAAALLVAAEPLAAVDDGTAVRKYELIHDDWHAAYCAVSPAVPLP
jgi:hypothetical protein